MVETTAAAAGVIGVLVGSFLNVLIHRHPAQHLLAAPVSHCPGCMAVIRPYDNIPVLSWNIPVLSWVAVRGRCRACGAPVPVRDTIVELMTGALFAGAGLRFGFHVATVAYCFFFAVLVALSGIDVDHRVIPKRLLYPAAGVSVVLLGLASATGGTGRPFEDAVAAAAIGFVFLLVVHLVSPRGMGFGDVRLAGFIGLNVGWLGVARIGVALFAGFVMGALVGILLIGTGRAGRRTALPFGPFLAAGAVVAVLAGGPVVHAWLG